MHATTIPATQLDDDLIAAWIEVLRDNPTLTSPYFRPEYTQLMARLRSRVEVAVLEDGGRPVGFFPFERLKPQIAGPVGAHFSDYQALIIPQDLEISVPSLLRSCRLSTWNFDHLLASQTSVRPYHWRRLPSPVIDLTGGFDAYLEDKKRAKSHTISESFRKERKLAREHGPVRFEPCVRDHELLETLMDWKRSQYRECSVSDAFAEPWTVDFLHELLRHTDDRFAGLLSALYAGDQPVALHFGIRANGLLHGLIPTFDRTFYKCSPGTVLLRKLLEAAPSLGIRVLDMGKGPESYKYSLMTGAVEVAEGSVDLRRLRSAARRHWNGFRQRVVDSSFRPYARAAARGAAKVFPPLHAWLALR